VRSGQHNPDTLMFNLWQASGIRHHGGWHNPWPLTSLGWMHLIPGLASSWRILRQIDLFRMAQPETPGSSIQLHLSLTVLDSSSGIVFAFPGRCYTDRKISYCKLHSYMEKARSQNKWEWVPPILFMYVTAVTLSSHSSLVMLCFCFVKHWTTRYAASSSR